MGERELTPRYAQVAVLAHLGRAGGSYTYGLPPELAGLVSPGMLVSVPFRTKQVQGVVLSLDTTSDLPAVRNVEGVLDPTPVVTACQLRLARWIAQYYAAPMSDIIGAMLPPGLGRKTVYALEMGSDPNGERLTAPQQAIVKLVTADGRMAFDDLRAALATGSGSGVSSEAVDHAVAQLVRRGLLRKVAGLASPRASPRVVKIASATEEGARALYDGRLGRAARQREALDRIVQNGRMPVPELSRLMPGASRLVAELTRKGLVCVDDEKRLRSPLNQTVIPATTPLRLSSAQEAAFNEIRSAVRAGRHEIFLLHGVTGSGKTEVYLQAIAEALLVGRQAIMMVPEISLTPQAIERVAGRFPGRVAVLHSQLSLGERLDEWQRIRNGEVDVVVGPRSALFAPLDRPGIIIVDEEHDPSYKQNESPRYNARDAAAVAGRIAGATIVFGSATPDVGTFHAARTGRIRLLELPNRPIWEGETGPSLEPAGRSLKPAGRSLKPAGRRPMPHVEVVDMRQELRSGNRSIFSTLLLEALGETLARSEQSLLFLNRRGSATVVICRDCGYVARCPSCDIPFTYHATATRLICHRCDRRVPSPRICPTCSSPRIRYLGVGTQRVEEEVKRLFPQSRVLRWDRDVTGGKESHGRILGGFARHEADILVGTQMIAKGLDFPLVTLVGVISADTGLHMPDFRAPERSFQLLTQVAGRAGRSSLPSQVVVQTYTPDHYAVQAAKDHDYHRFVAEEMGFRQSARYPPLARLVRLVYSAGTESQCQDQATGLRAVLERAIEVERIAGAEVIGPAPCFVARVNNRYYWQIIIRSIGDPHPLLDHVPAGWSIDVDPVDLL
ncbi:MAG: primosomal protein N' [Chloroflexota bacterium]|nr:primosomal protein N' [Chloroflexota bacterium]